MSRSAVTAGAASGGERQHCLVVGAGIVGSCCAWHLARRGHQVTLVDRLAPGQATSFGNAACVSPSHVVPFSYPGVWKKLPSWLRDPLGPLTVRWQHLPWLAPWLARYLGSGTEAGVKRSATAQAALMHRVVDDYHRLLEQAALSHLLKSRGALAIYDRQEEFAAERWIFDMEASHGFDYRVLPKEEVAALAPALALAGGLAIMLPSWQHTLDPGALTAGIAESAMQHGAQFQAGSVRRVRRNDSVTLEFEDGRELSADLLVVAAGAWSNKLVSQLEGKPVPMTAKRGYHSMISEPGVALELPIISQSRGFVMTPLADGLRLAGTAEFARLDADPDYRRARILVDHAKDYLPGLQTSSVEEWMGQRPMMSDSIPVIGPSPSGPRVFYAFGHGHYGLTQGPTTGQLIADLVDGLEPGLDMRPYALERFA